MTPKPRPRYVLVDAVRGIAACAVMLYHFTGGDLRPGLTQLFGARALDVCHHGWLGVQVFFVLSGFVIAHTIGDRDISAGDALRFALRRQVRLDPPYWTSLGISLFIPWFTRFLGFRYRMNPPLRVIAAHVFYLQDLLGVRAIQPVYWTLAIEVQFYMAFVMALLLLRPVPAFATRWLVLASGLASLDAGMHWRFLGGWFMPHWYLFVLGAATLWTVQRKLPLALHVGLALYTAWYGIESGRLEPLAGAITSLTLVFAGRTGGLERWLGWRWIQFLGRISYGVYLLHPLAGAQARWHVGVKVDVTHGPGALAVLLSAIALTIAASWALHVLVEAPAMRLAGRIRWWHGDPARAVTAP